ncbi:hypothetical protein H8B09_24105 [Paenibacillus sp. PR3]|uniref:Lipoprotein n=1 Tax=Paenibacillus terricola TaxID=2763503 RepID=A0ABR8N103_9BACL|nr:hypothetical protein [Paenibacillus terricola]MBD3921866.1 hypothetical protein [Paenibacillus terricola]
MSKRRAHRSKQLVLTTAAGACMLLLLASVTGCSTASEEGSRSDREQIEVIGDAAEDTKQDEPVTSDVTQETSPAGSESSPISSALEAEPERNFDDVYLYNPVVPGTSGELMVDPQTLVYAVNGDTESKLYRYDLVSRASELVGSFPSSSITIGLSRVQKDTVDITYWSEEYATEHYAAWSAATGKLEQQRVIGRNEQWTLYYGNVAPGIWAAPVNGADDKGVRLTSYDIDNSPLWIPGTNRFVYIRHTGNTIADGSGYEFVLAMYDLDVPMNQELPLGMGPWMMRGWLEPGKTLLVDHAFNEGESVDYTVPYIVDLSTMKEKPLLPEGTGAHDISFGPLDAGFVLVVKDDLQFYDSNAKLTAKVPLLSDSGERLRQRFTYSPDGKKGFYTMETADNTASDGTVERIVVANADGSHAARLNEKAVNIGGVQWLPDGETLFVLAEKDGQLYAATKRVK